MHVLLLGAASERLRSYLDCASTGPLNDPIDVEQIAALRVDALVSFGYRHVLRPEVLQALDRNSFNIHISLLPWNRGADPNFWSWVENTPRGVSCHVMTDRVDAGEILGQSEVALEDTLTLRESYEVLCTAAVDLFREHWASIAEGSYRLEQQLKKGSHHRAADRLQHLAAMPNGWDTQCRQVKEYGFRHGLWLRTPETDH